MRVYEALPVRDDTHWTVTIATLALASVVAGQTVRTKWYWRDVTTIVLVMIWQDKPSILTKFCIALDKCSGPWLAVMLVALMAIFTFRLRQQRSITECASAESDQKSFLKPMIFPCRTTHTRFFPSKHSFGYSYLFVGVPVGWHGRAGTLLSTNASPSPRTWFSVNAADYLQRRSAKVELRSKLDDYLRSQQIDVDRFPHAYLVTAPRFLGFSFNPVSFWYLYDDQRRLRAMILEVNNTFDERRMYFMESGRTDDISGDVFTQEWAKDFHVSPFNDRGGSYSLTAKNPAAASGELQVDNNIVLRSAEGKAKLVARVFSSEPAFDPCTPSSLRVALFLSKWWWVGFVTNLRILWEARILWSKKLQVFYRPEVVRTSIGRNETVVEQQLEPHFRAFLQHLLDASPTQSTLSYTPAAGPDRGTAIQLTRGSEKPALVGDIEESDLEIVVLTPEFYAELTRHSTIEGIFRHCCFEAATGGIMVQTSDQATFKALLDNHTPQSIQGKPILHPQVLLRRGGLTQSPHAINIKNPDSKLVVSEFDSFVYSTHPELYTKYIRNVIWVLCADRFAFGVAPLFNLEIFALRLVMLYWIFRLFASPIRDALHLG